MSENVSTAPTDEATAVASLGSDGSRRGLVAAGGIIGAIAAASCCILPLALTVAGISGAWMANLRVLAPYQPFVIAMTIALLGYGFYLVYWKPRKACADSSACTRPLVSNRVVQGALWLATLIVLLAITFNYWFPLIVPYLP